MKPRYQFLLKINGTILCLLIFSLGFVRQANSQVEPFGAGYFADQYLFNPAFAGSSANLFEVSGGYREEMLSVSDSPSNFYFSGSMGINGKAGLGLHIYQDRAGLLKTTRVVGTFAWHMILGGTSKLSLGLSAGTLNTKTDDVPIVGDQEESFHESRFDADFGAAFTNGGLTVQTALPGVACSFNDDWENVGPDFFSSVSYRFSVFHERKVKVSVEPKISYRSLDGYDDVFDAGLNIGLFNNRIDFLGMYHTTENITVGFELNIIKSLSMMAFYTTPAPALKSYTDGSLEIGTSLKLGKH